MTAQATLVAPPEPDAASDSGAMFIVPMDMGNAIQCDPWTQDCPAGEKCTAWASNGTGWDATKCVPIDPNPVGPGEPCIVQGSAVSGMDNCVKGAMCFFVDSQTNEGTCVPLCTCSESNPVCNDTSTTCLISNESVLNLCLPLCDPLNEMPCADGSLCAPNPTGDGFVCVIDASSGNVPGSPCDFANACPNGTICAFNDVLCNNPSGGCCTPLCDLDTPSACSDPIPSCTPFYPPGQAPDCLDDLGLCSAP